MDRDDRQGGLLNPLAAPRRPAPARQLPLVMRLAVIARQLFTRADPPDRVELDAKSKVFTIDVPSEPSEVRLDPNLKVLMQATFERETRR